MAASPTTSITYQNFYSATLTSDITSSATDIFLDVVPNGSEGFLVIEPDSTSAREVIYYNSKTATKVVCPSAADGRGQDDTTAGAHLTGSVVIMAPVAAYFEALLSLFTTSPQGWTSLSGTFTSPTYNGQRSYTITTSVDQSAIVSPGMRLRTQRTVAAPTQCTSLNGTTQYYSKASPAGMTFTDDFVCSAWVKLNSYGSGTTSIISRYNGTSGWQFVVGPDGKFYLQGYNAGAANISYVASSQSLPIGRWVHVAAQLDMSTFTATTTTSYTMIDGVDVPASVTRGGTNPTALIQAGNLEIGSSNGGSQFFPGKIAQAAVYSAKVTQANIRTTISQTLAGTETSLISAYSFNNSINDLNTTNANNLTANGAAVATNADSPFAQNSAGTPLGTYEYAIITAVTSSTITCQVPEGNAIPTSGGITACSYSTYKAPFGFPTQTDKWTLEVWVGSNLAQSVGATGSWTAFTGAAITVPVGNFIVGHEGTIQLNCGVAASIDGFFSMGSTSPPLSALTTRVQSQGGVNITYVDDTIYRETGITPTTATVYSMYSFYNTASGTIGSLLLGAPPTTTAGPGFRLFAKNALL